jgi:hypothetical protein
MCVSLADAAPAQAAYRYGSFVLNNPSNVTIYYQIKWGNNEWENFSVGPGEWHAHYVDLGPDQMIPVPYVRFDFVTWDDSVTTQTYEVDAYGVDYPSEGKDYTFQYTSDGRFLDLFED